jgi:hypothetical protein
MSDERKLRTIHGGPDGESVPWPPKEEAEMRETFESLMRDGDQVFVFGFRRLPNNETEIVDQRIYRGASTSFFELVGHLYAWLVTQTQR